nr:hypothetical protein [uncultured Sphingomonas sp.]
MLQATIQEPQWNGPIMSRRGLLRLAAGSATAVGLSACGVKAPQSASSRFGGIGDEAGFRLSWGGRGVDVLTYSPTGLPLDRPVVMSLHGYSRLASSMMDKWKPLADQFGLHIIIPHFDERNFPGDSYAMGGDGMGSPGTRPIDALGLIFDQARARSGLTASEFGLFGHSAGAQLAHRYLMLSDNPRVRAAVVSAAGWYTMPDAGCQWPYGLQGTGVALRDLDPIWSKKVLLLVGDEDVGRQDLRWTNEAVAQGRTRIERSRSYFDRSCSVAAQRGIAIDWRMETVTNCGHESRKPIERAASFLA